MLSVASRRILSSRFCDSVDLLGTLQVIAIIEGKKRKFYLHLCLFCAFRDRLGTTVLSDSFQANSIFSFLRFGRSFRYNVVLWQLQKVETQILLMKCRIENLSIVLAILPGLCPFSSIRRSFRQRSVINIEGRNANYY